MAALWGIMKQESIVMHLIVGLGNPGREYDKTRHNVGFVAIDYLAEQLGIKMSKLKFKGIYGEGFLGTEKCILLKPQTFMNLSGQSVREAAEFYKIEPENIIVLYDDVTLDPGKVRIRPSGSAGGHNGMKNIIYLLNSDKFTRVRFGVGAPQHDLADHVLGHFNDEDGVAVTRAIKNTEDILSVIFKMGVSEAMSRFNNKVL